MSLRASEIKIGKRYVMAEPPFCEAIVTIMDDKSGANQLTKHSAEWVGWVVRYDEILQGDYPELVGKEVEVGWDEKYSHYSPIRFYLLSEKAE